MDLEEAAVANGFDSSYEMMTLVAWVDLSTNEKLMRFNSWKFLDGTKEGLLKLLRGEE